MTSAHPERAAPPPRIADANRGLCHVFVRDLVIPVSIGVHPHEREAPQPVRINLDLAVREPDDPERDRYDNVVCYETLVERLREMVAQGHLNLVETLAEDIAALCLEDTRVRSARVRVEKLTIIEDAASVGVEIERFSRAG